MNQAISSNADVRAHGSRELIAQGVFFAFLTTLLLGGGVVLFATHLTPPEAGFAARLAPTAKPPEGNPRTVTSLVLVAESEEAAATLRSLFNPALLDGRRDLSVTVIVATNSQLLYQLVDLGLGAGEICWDLACGHAFVIDMRPR